jgi:LuxR family maltose regulon positive regulatory protein
MILNDLYLARVRLARGDVLGAESIASKAEQTALKKNIRIRLKDIAYCQSEIHFRQGHLDVVLRLARENDLPLMQARALIAQGDLSGALNVIEPLHQQAVAGGWPQRLLEVKAVQSVALYAQGEKQKAVELVKKVLEQAEQGGFIRLFLNEGALMTQLLLEAASKGIKPDYIARLLAAFEAEMRNNKDKTYPHPHQPLIEPLSQRELEILKLVAQGLSNEEICKTLFLALDTVKGHNRRIFEKLQVHRRTEAIARARELDLI